MASSVASWVSRLSRCQSIWVGVRFARERVIEALALHPRPRSTPSWSCPRGRSGVTQQLLCHGVTRRAARAADLVTAAQQITGPFGLRRRRGHEPQQAAAKPADELLGVRTVGLGLDPIPARDGTEDGAITSHATRSSSTVAQRKPTRPRFVADRQPSRPPRLVINRRIAFSIVSIRVTSGHPPDGGSTAATIENYVSRATHRRTFSRRGRDNVRHGLVLRTSGMRLWPKWPVTPLTLTRVPAT